MLSDPGAVLPGHSLPAVPGRGAGFLLWGCCGVFSVPLEKTVIFLTAPKDHNPAALSSLSDECRRLQSLHEEFRLRWQNYGLTGQLEISHF